MDNLESIKEILGSFLTEKEMARRIEQLEMPLSEVEDKWPPHIPKPIAKDWGNLDSTIKSAFQVLCIQIADLEQVAEDYRDHFLD